MLNPYAKALVAGLVAALTALTPALDGGLSGKEIVGVVLAGLVGSGVTYVVPNRPRAAQGEAGETLATIAIAVSVVVIALVAVFGRP